MLITIRTFKLDTNIPNNSELSENWEYTEILCRHEGRYTPPGRNETHFVFLILRIFYVSVKYTEDGLDAGGKAKFHNGQHRRLLSLVSCLMSLLHFWLLQWVDSVLCCEHSLVIWYSRANTLSAQRGKETIKVITVCLSVCLSVCPSVRLSVWAPPGGRWRIEMGPLQR